MNGRRTYPDKRVGAGNSSPLYELRLLPAWSAPYPWRGLTDSIFLHAALLGLLYWISTWPQPRVHLVNSHPYHAFHGYQLSLYLPELHGAPTARKQGGKADPVQARQEIRSVPDAPDNQRQTIITPPEIKLQHDVELPNLVGYKQAPPAPPLNASSLSAVLQVPATLPERVPVIVQAKPQRALPKLQASQPAPGVDAIHRRTNLAEMIPPVANPILSEPQLARRAPEIVQLKPQRARSLVQPPAAQPAPGLVSAGAPNVAQLLPQRAEPALPAPQAAPQSGDARTPPLVALSVHPADVQGPLAIPEGNRRGAFAASPSGHANATGAPGAGETSGVGATNPTGKVNAPPGITVGTPPGPASEVDTPNAPSATGAEPDLRTKLMAAMRAPVTASIPPRAPAAQQPTHKPTEVENHIFAGRRSYTLVVNMPNLNAALGSWIIRYVDREQGLVPEPITTPEVVRKSDPAVPSELTDLRGVVILTAIIRADGTVTDIAVAQSLFAQLDQNAAEALSHWLFRPALKNGQPIDLEAVITVPFRTK